MPSRKNDIDHISESNEIRESIIEGKLQGKKVDLSFEARENERTKMLQYEWALFYPDNSPKHFLMAVKNFTETQYVQIMKKSPMAKWNEQKDRIRERLALQVAEKHVEKIAQMNDEHIKAGRLGLAKGIKLLAEGVRGFNKKNPSKILKRDLKPQEFQHVMSGLKLCQQIYRTAMGLPSDGDGMRQLLVELAEKQGVQNNVQINVNAEDEKSGLGHLKALLESLSHEEIKLFVERKRALMREKVDRGE